MREPNTLVLVWYLFPRAYKYLLQLQIRAEERERDRIIALLEATDILKTIEQGVLVNYAEDAIALIKGETE